MKFKFKFILILVVLLVPYFGTAQFYYGLQQEFGKNRVQYQPFNWTYFGFDRYQVYSYEGGQEISRYVSRQMAKLLPEVEKKLDFQTDELIQVIVYNNQGDFRQSNLGLASEEQSNTGGVTKIVGTKMSVYFNGNHADLDKQIRAGIAEVVLNDMLYGGRTRDVIKNSTFLILPDWFRLGAISYMSESWSVDMDNKVMDGIENDRYYNFNKLSGPEAILAGHSLWGYIAETYGESVIPNILYMAKVSRSVENAFMFVLGTNSRSLTYEWIDSYARRNLTADTTRTFPKDEPILKKPKETRNYYNAKLSPDGNQLVYVSLELSQHKVWLRDLTTGKQKRIVKWGPKLERINDFSYPLLAWHPNGSAFAMIHEKKGIIYLTTYQVEDKIKYSRPIVGIEKVIDFGYSPDGRKFVFSGVKKGKGQSDIFVFQINAGGLEQITNDTYDDSNPRFAANGKQILFSSNRYSDTLKAEDNSKYDYELVKDHDIFMYDVQSKSKVLMRITNTPGIHESKPNDYNDGYITYLSEANGIRNRFIARFDSVIAYVDTSEHYRYTFYPRAISNGKRNIEDQDFSFKSGKVIETYYDKGKDWMYISEMPKASALKPAVLKNTYYRRSVLYAPKMTYQSTVVIPQKQKDKINREKDKGKDVIDINNYSFDNEKPAEEVPEVKDKVSEKRDSTLDVSKKEFRYPIQQNYYTNFSVDNIVTQLDNSFLAQTYQRFTGFYINPGVNAFFKIALSDLFEDYRILGAFRISGNLNNEFLLSIENRKKNWDKQLILHRQSFPSISSDGSSFLKIHTHDAQFKLRTPFNEVSGLRSTLLYRNDRTVFAATDDYNLPLKNKYDNWAGLKFEYIFDNTRARGLNLFHGTRAKVFVEYLRLISKTQHDLFVFGFDIRNYKKVHRNLIWANRLAGSTSQGTDKLVYYLGGVDGWFTPKFDRDINILHPEAYGFQTIATNMRGFKQNIRNGNNFLVLNSELRWPIFSYLLNRPIRSDFINNFQVVGFCDLGTAWYGVDPTSAENSENRITYYGNPITIVVIEPKQPVVMGYGIGLRSRLFGYFFRIDISRGLDFNGNVSKVNYLSFTTDF